MIINPYAFPPPASGGDPDWASVVSLLHFNGTDGSTTFTDETGRTWSANGNAQIDTAQSKFGGASLLLDGSGDYASSADSADFLFPGDFAVEAFVRIAAGGLTQAIMGQWGTTVGNRSWLLFLDTANRLMGGLYVAGQSVFQGPATSLTVGTWHHVAMTRSGSTVRLFLDGVAGSNNTLAGSLQNSPAAVQIGVYDGATSPFNGHIDEVRITKGVARYTSNFLVPTAEFPNHT